MKPPKPLLISIFDGLIIGIMTGLVCAAFLHLLAISGELFRFYPSLLYALPVCGLLTVWLYKRFGEVSSLGNHLIIDEIHEPKKDIPLIMAPLIFVTTIISHLFGASVGREGTAVQMGASLASTLSKKLNVDTTRRKYYLIAGMAAGFGAALGTPIAGIVFGMEVLHFGRFKVTALVQSIFASLTAYAITLLCLAPHSSYPNVIIQTHWQVFFYLTIAAILMGLFARLFVKLLHLTENKAHQLVANPYLRIIIISLILVACFLWDGTTNYNGLGISVIQDSFLVNSPWFVPFKKMIFTVLSLGAGFKGGEFTPLAFMGATLGSAFASHFALSISLFAACGFSAVFGAASKTPLACAVMAAELFGLNILPYALIACLVSYMVSGRLSIYKFQR